MSEHEPEQRQPNQPQQPQQQQQQQQAMRKQKRHGGSPVRRKDVEEVLRLVRQEGPARDTHRLNRLFEKAIKDKDLGVIRVLLAHGVKIEPLNEACQTPIHFAVENGWVRAVELLFAHCDSEVNHSDRDGLSHLHIACMTGQTEVARRFLRAGVDAQLRFRPRRRPDARDGFTPLHFAVECGRPEVAQLLLEHGADPEAADRLGRTALHLAAATPRAIGDAVLPKKFDVFHKNENGYARAVAAAQASLELVGLLLRHGARPEARDLRGDAALSHVFTDGTLDYVESKFARGSLDFRIFSKVFSRAKRAIVEQLRRRQRLKLKLLLEHGAPAGLRNLRRETPLHRLLGELGAARRLGQFPEPYLDDAVHAAMARLLVRWGAPLAAPDAAGRTPLQLAVALLSAELVQVLLAAGAPVHGLSLARLRFEYPPVLPCLEATENLVEVVGALRARGMRLRRADGLALLRFLVRNNAGCRYADPLDEDAAYKLANLLELGTPRNVLDSLERLDRLNGLLSDQLDRYLVKLDNAGLSLEPELDQCLRCRLLRRDFSELTQHNLNEFREEAELLGRLLLGGGGGRRSEPVAHLLRLPPDALYPRLANTNYKQLLRSSYFYKNFYHTKGLVKGCVARSLVRRYVVKSANDYIRTLVDFGLPDPCCEAISAYLSNEDLYNLCLASHMPPPPPCTQPPSTSPDQPTQHS